MVGENLAPADTLSGHVGIAHPREFSWHEPATAAPIRIEPWRVKEWRYRGERMRRWSPSMATPTVGHLQPCCSCHWPLAPAPCTTRTSSSIPATRATPPFDRSCHSSAYAASPSTPLLCPTLPRCLPPPGHSRHSSAHTNPPPQRSVLVLSTVDIQERKTERERRGSIFRVRKLI